MVSLNLKEMSQQQESFTLPFPVRPFSVAEYEAIAQAGILDEHDNVELLEGWIVPKMTKNPFHEGVITQLHRLLEQRLPRGFQIRIQCVVITPDSAPEPDLAVVRGEPRDYYRRHPRPEDVSLLIEVAESSVALDRKKSRIYARAGIPIYWIVNLRELCVEVFTNPVDGQYENAWSFSMTETLEAALADGSMITLPVSEFLTQQ